MTRTLHITNDLLMEVLAGKASLLMDGAMGTAIQDAGLAQVHKVPDLLNLTHPDAITAIHLSYVDAGSDCITTNTFNTNALKLEGTDVSVADVYAAAVACARDAGARLIAGDIGPTGEMLDPYGDLEVEEAYELFADQAVAARDAGCDLLLVETMIDPTEACAAVRACVENTDLPVFASMTFAENGRTMFGTAPADAATLLIEEGASVVGANCSLGPALYPSLIRDMAAVATPQGVPVSAQPNAGLPRLVDGKNVYDIGPEEFARAMAAVLEAGASVVGGCCGTTPAHIAGLRNLLDGDCPAL